MQVRRGSRDIDTLPNTSDDSDYATAVEKLNEYFSPQTNIAYEAYNFRQTKQKDAESLDSYHTRLRQLAKTCEFSNIDTEIKEHIILTCSSNSLYDAERCVKILRLMSLLNWEEPWNLAKRKHAK